VHRGLLTIPSAIAVVALAASRSRPARLRPVAPSPEALDSFDAHRAKEQQGTFVVAIPAAPP
jgi:hypothetical protein